jgi:hypothetical protein
MSRVGALGPAPQPVSKTRLIARTSVRALNILLALVACGMAVILPGKSEKSEFVNWNYSRIIEKKWRKILVTARIYIVSFGW